MRLQLDEATVKAPADGIIASLPEPEGAMVGPTVSIASIVSSDVEITVRVEEARIGEVKEGQPATIRVSAYPDQTFEGTISIVAPVADPADRTFEVTLEPDVQNGQLRGGMFAEVNLVTEQHADALLVPSSAVVTEGGNSFVFVVNGDQVEKREVTAGLAKRDVTQVESGLFLGEQVIISGQGSLEAGDIVQAVSTHL
jgi:RND family efflux transporter MFP subunit